MKEKPHYLLLACFLLLAIQQSSSQPLNFTNTTCSSNQYELVECYNMNTTFGCSQGCMACDPNFGCLSCQMYGYYLNVATNSCSTCPPGCDYCMSGSICFMCLNGYHLNMIATCDPNPAGCLMYDNFTSSCFNCSSLGFYMDSTNAMPGMGTCVACQSGCASCDPSNPCLACAPGYYNSTCTGLCTPCTIPGCYTCDPFNPQVCSSCQPGYYMAQGACLACPVGCNSCDHTGCLSCQMFYMPYQGCSYCDMSCDTCNGPSNLNCTSCPTEYALVPLGGPGQCQYVGAAALSLSGFNGTSNGTSGGDPSSGGIQTMSISLDPTDDPLVFYVSIYPQRINSVIATITSTNPPGATIFLANNETALANATTPAELAKAISQNSTGNVTLPAVCMPGSTPENATNITITPAEADQETQYTGDTNNYDPTTGIDPTSYTYNFTDNGDHRVKVTLSSKQYLPPGCLLQFSLNQTYFFDTGSRRLLQSTSAPVIWNLSQGTSQSASMKEYYPYSSTDQDKISSAQSTASTTRIITQVGAAIDAVLNFAAGGLAVTAQNYDLFGVVRFLNITYPANIQALFATLQAQPVSMTFFPNVFAPIQRDQQIDVPVVAPGDFPIYNIKPWIMDNFGAEVFQFLIMLAIAVIFILIKRYVAPKLFTKKPAPKIVTIVAPLLYHLIVWNTIITFCMTNYFKVVMYIMINFYTGVKNTPWQIFNMFMNVVMLLVLCSPIFTVVMTRIYFKRLDKYKEKHPELKDKLEGKESAEPETALALKAKEKQKEIENPDNVDNAKEGGKEGAVDPVRIEYEIYKADKKQKEEEDKDTIVDLEALIKSYKRVRFYQAYYASFNLFRGFIVFGVAVWGNQNPYGCGCTYLAVTSFMLLFLIIVRPFQSWKDNICQIGCEILNIIFYAMATSLTQTPLSQVTTRNNIGFAMIAVNSTLYIWMLIMSWVQNFITGYFAVKSGKLWWKFRKYRAEDEAKEKKEAEEKKKKEEEDKKNGKTSDKDKKSDDEEKNKLKEGDIELVVNTNGNNNRDNEGKHGAISHNDVELDTGLAERENHLGNQYSFKTNKLSDAQRIH